MTKKSKVLLSILAVVVCMLFGCERKNTVLEADAYQPEQEINLTEWSACEEVEGFLKEGTEAKEYETQEASGVQAKQEEKQEKSGSLVIHICGAVKHPGVYKLEEGSRVYQAIEQAGGFAEEADEDYLNQADVLSDGRKLYVPTREETELQGFLPEQKDGQDEGLVNINTASEEVLLTLPGIGEGKAKSIIAYREKNGRFQSIEEIMKVEGIKEGLFHKVKDSITV